VETQSPTNIKPRVDGIKYGKATAVKACRYQKTTGLYHFFFQNESQLRHLKASTRHHDHKKKYPKIIKRPVALTTSLKIDSAPVKHPSLLAIHPKPMTPSQIKALSSLRIIFFSTVTGVLFGFYQKFIIKCNQCNHNKTSLLKY
jgi:hypothetical protein